MYDFLIFLSFNIALQIYPYCGILLSIIFLQFIIFTQLLQLIIHSIANECLKCVQFV